ncbi:ribonuclease Y [Candidatus Gottesmanbacteria bacterium RIFCSPHIGHO2_02_FULL_40_24]|uniref:Ribonuclease Y n=1 Tax=Candidatus Gottesmanbacteria bacterium RIFCSPHIGHO2_01_FULL_40_15 TaxID=1798376 RepID=A0A1F5Z737_9BACT|nr:MAG: ribonuclease Y [Candidatus Gottesmanbacteria bacterium RIFCSPHIGHO2_01_FULL_40_15]OGG18314.1 MAG: ribonuclease Y [Candidatus Gottesmanbacteria bacterium RIFCSPHIGHO2_02_FULL_40_24]OGG22925.1 MAG: ribonuclease Y [Candidatus Gottesmanbacteria bacterium RIFCSPLOWO2_01_FULL_40_10]OGG23543.1 MAG: ribonuclease Y [Candidatus Gottesmanbacteria bacterium RIFCSPHIGHO2_12_FULL_40_13]OGG32667.1 MAG: ribonuclease Y [Candidatus Gottesmanbacteria bacterium RIFCSPLOWO2_02_FULL_40_10]
MPVQSPPPRIIETNINEVRTEAKAILIEAKDEAFRIKREAEEESRKIRQEALTIEQKIIAKEENIDKKLAQLDDRERSMKNREDSINKKLAEIDKYRNDLISKLENVAHLTRDEAKNLILTAVEEKLKEEIAVRIKEAENQAKQEADRKVREILIDAMRHGATDYVPEYTVSTIKITDEDFKGRIIGKEGRNIRAFEMATGVDVDLDEEGVIRLSSFDPVRREIARVTLEKLIKDGRVQPVRIEELVKQTKEEIERIMFKEGEKLCHTVGVYNLPADKIALLGRFKFRFSYGQNMIAHTLEETKIGIALASELGADINVVRLGCLLHDIGKVITDKEGSHVQLGVELLKKNNMPKAIIDCVAAHHEDIPFPSLEAVIVYVADAISGSRPGARYENIDEYVKRLKSLEDIATSFSGIEKAYALQAGRELRVIVDSGKMDDAQVVVTTRKIRDEIEKKFPTFPGQIKITSIRELRVTETVH